MIPGVDLDYLPSPNLAGLVGGLVGLEQGGTVTKGGAFMVGESGPEVVNLSPGDAVTPNNQITGNGGGGSAGPGGTGGGGGSGIVIIRYKYQ